MLILMLWAIIALLMTLTGCIYAGLNTDTDIVAGFLFLGVFWPVLLVIGLLFAPFYGVYELTRLFRMKGPY